ncbi:hypothetical protein J2S00_001209 [Caldalkalibacillus uzonensis]|uniref:Uncharacterized protein n=1 Tax=Caldalkalibacillus uzonensis TaxID=353224 RepID=A0ABU0CPT6_9BACI|nr:hypothetical protein [Caldalkalibacillus uzonensis]MDQ0338425.1 hypothetical protein [Caldalkalibacillus uzonensis]
MGIEEEFGGGFYGEFSVALRESDEDQSQYFVSVAFTDESGYASARFDIPVFEGPIGIRPHTLQEKREVKAGESMAVWVLVAGEGSDYYRIGETIEELVQRVEWALVIKVTVEDDFVDHEQ